MYGTPSPDPRWTALLDVLQHVGDPLADAVLDEAARDPAAAALVDDGLARGSSAIGDRSLALRALLEEAERESAAVSGALLERGSSAYLAIGHLWISLSLGPGSLVHTYSAAPIARVLTATGNLERMAERRILETGAWLTTCVLPGGMSVGGRGYVRTLQVRLLHARVRRALAREGRVAINQVEMARTWLDFTYVPFAALRRLGVTFSAEELRDLYAFWRHIGRLVGVDARLCGAVTDDETAAALLAAIDARFEGVCAESRALTEAMLDALAQILADKLPLTKPMAFALLNEVTRRFQGDALADALGVRRTRLRPLMDALSAYNRGRCWLQRSFAPARQWTIRQTIDVYEKGIEEVRETPFGQFAKRPAEQGLPRSLTA
jgi:ER-bound oxygenase mpaB/B'/Rubber oxygenase, catalytic domain